MHRSTIATLACAGGLSLTAVAAGSVIETGTYRLHNHPDSGSPLAFGLQLDELFDVTPGHDRFTFDFDAPGAEMYLDYDGVNITISGTAFGGLETLDGMYDEDFSSLVYVQFTYGQSSLAPGDDDLIVDAQNFEHIGAVSWLRSGQSIPLFDYRGNDEQSFRFGDETDDLGHRGFDGLSGWGGLAHGPTGVHIDSSEWLFSAQRIPGPASLSVFAVAFAGGRRRRC